MFIMYQWSVAQQWREQSSYQRTWPASSYTTPPRVSGRACRTCRGVGGAMRCSSTTVDWLSLVESRLTVGWWETRRSLTGNGGLTQGATWGSQGRVSPWSRSSTSNLSKPHLCPFQGASLQIFKASQASFSRPQQQEYKRWAKNLQSAELFHCPLHSPFCDKTISRRWQETREKARLTWANPASEQATAVNSWRTWLDELFGMS